MKRLYINPFLPLVFVMMLGCNQLEQVISSEAMLPRYPIKNPLVLLAGASKYDITSGFKDLPGVKQDMKLLYDLFANFYGYETHSTFTVYGEHLTRGELNKFIRKGYRDLEATVEDRNKHSYDGLIFALLGHGFEGTFVTSDGRERGVNRMQSEFDNESADFFIGRPRIFMKIACRGTDYSEGVSLSRNKSQEWYCKSEGFFTIYPTTVGRKIRDSISIGKGAPFTIALVKLLRNEKERKQRLEDIIKILGIRVNEMTNGRECVEQKSTLRTILYLCKKSEEFKLRKPKRQLVAIEEEEKKTNEYCSQDSQGWNCSRCSFMSSGKVRFCGMCGNKKAGLKVSKNQPLVFQHHQKSKTKPESKSKPKSRFKLRSTSWECSACSYTNLSNATLCLLCHNFSPNTLPVKSYENYECLSTLKGQATVSSLSPLPGGYLASAGVAWKGGFIEIWDPLNGECIRTLKVHTGYVSSLCSLPGGYLASGSFDNTIKIWDPLRGKCLKTLKGHTNRITSLASLCRGQLASGDYRGTIKIWDPLRGKCLSALRGHAMVNLLSPLTRGHLASNGGDGTIKIWDPLNGKRIRTLKGHIGSIASLCPLPGGYLASGDSGGIIKIWEPFSGKCIKTLKGHHPKFVRSLCPLPGGHLASGSYEGIIKILDPFSGRCMKTLTGHTYTDSLCPLPGGYLVSSHSQEVEEGVKIKNIKIWGNKSF